MGFIGRLFGRRQNRRDTGRRQTGRAYVTPTTTYDESPVDTTLDTLTTLAVVESLSNDDEQTRRAAYEPTPIAPSYDPIPSYDPTPSYNNDSCDTGSSYSDSGSSYSDSGSSGGDCGGGGGD